MNFRFLCVSTALAAAVGCYTGSAVDTNRFPGSSTNGTDPTGPAPKKTEKTTGIPCAVSEILLESCADCHGSFLVGAKTHLLSYEDLTAKSEDDPSLSVAELAVARMRSADKPMPPDETLDAAKIGAFEKWIKAGLPRGSCGDEAPVDVDAGTTDPIPVDAGEPDASSVCTSGKSYDTAHGTKTSSMAPGTSCLSCHSPDATHPATTLFAAGTIYPTMHEPDECIGTSSANLTVVLIDAEGASHTVAVNAAGNFVRYTSFPLPYRAFVFRGNDVREMNTPQTDGDCNGCHSEWGKDSPGRVMAP
jgi:mono/diheme cytochrome c family protein